MRINKLVENCWENYHQIVDNCCNANALLITLHSTSGINPTKFALFRAIDINVGGEMSPKTPTC